MDLQLGLEAKARMPYVGFVRYIKPLMCERGNEAWEAETANQLRSREAYDAQRMCMEPSSVIFMKQQIKNSGGNRMVGKDHGRSARIRHCQVDGDQIRASASQYPFDPVGGT
jgi:hypothetical protein